MVCKRGQPKISPPRTAPRHAIFVNMVDSNGNVVQRMVAFRALTPAQKVILSNAHAAALNGAFDHGHSRLARIMMNLDLPDENALDYGRQDNIYRNHRIQFHRVVDARMAAPRVVWPYLVASA